MSLINDALKQARKAPPRNTPTALPPLQPAAEESSPVLGWLLPAILILLVVAGIFFTGWAVSHRSVHQIVAANPPPSVTQEVAQLSLPVVKPRPAEPAPLPPPPEAPKLQGIFYSATAPSAIIDGRTVRPGDAVGQYKVKTITKFTVTLVGADKKEFQIGMSN